MLYTMFRKEYIYIMFVELNPIEITKSSGFEGLKSYIVLIFIMDKSTLI